MKLIKDKKNQIPKWLKNLQENSWELELLISGGAIFSLFKFNAIYLDWMVTSKLFFSSILPGQYTLFLIGLLGIKILTLGFSVHILMRAYWLSLVCINYVYPQGINANNIKWKKPFKTDLKDGSNLRQIITKVDKYCGIIIFTSIISVFSVLGIMFLFTIFFNLLRVIGMSHIISLIFIAYLILYIIDLLCFGIFRRIPYLSYLIYPVFRLFDKLSLRVHYQPALFILNTNIKKLRFVISASLFAIFAIILTYYSARDFLHWPNLLDQRMHQTAENKTISYSYYLDEHITDQYYSVAISSKIQTGNYLELFITYEKHYDFLFSSSTNTNSSAFLSDLFELNIDKTEINNISWHPSERPNEINGISCMIPIKAFQNGNHELIININDMNTKKISNSISIPFWIDK